MSMEDFRIIELANGQYYKVMFLVPYHNTIFDISRVYNKKRRNLFNRKNRKTFCDIHCVIQEKTHFTKQKKSTHDCMAHISIGK